MTARPNWNERVLVVESETVRRSAVGCIAWLDVGGFTSSQSLVDFKIMSGDNLTLIGLMHLF
jgi:hypothetical protein